MELNTINEKMKMELVGDPLEWKQAPTAEVLEKARQLGKLFV